MKVKGEGGSLFQFPLDLSRDKLAVGPAPVSRGVPQVSVVRRSNTVSTLLFINSSLNCARKSESPLLSLSLFIFI